jgi:hypothetical protein
MAKKVKETLTQQRIRILNRLLELAKNDDPETGHVEADNLLLELIDDEEITKAFKSIRRWYA